ncbi:hypothetical protein SRHO_G00192890 [Serrasalmus rhombeus]
MSPELRGWIVERSPSSAKKVVEMAEAFAAATMVDGEFKPVFCRTVLLIELSCFDLLRMPMDVVGPLPRSRGGNCYILVVYDYAARMVVHGPGNIIRQLKYIEGRTNCQLCHLTDAHIVQRPLNYEVVKSYRVQQEQIAAIFKLLKDNQDTFGEVTEGDIEEQLKLYTY